MIDVRYFYSDVIAFQLREKFYADTALFGAAAATRCGLSFFGVDQVLFASDTPFEPEPGTYIRETIDVIDNLEITADERDRIYWKNARQLLRLDLGER